MLLATFIMGFTTVLFVVIVFLTTHYNLPVPYFNPNYTHKDGKTTKVNKTQSPARKSELSGHVNTMVSNHPENDKAWHHGTDPHTSTQSWRNNHHHTQGHPESRRPYLAPSTQPRMMRSLFGDGASYKVAGQTLHVSSPQNPHSQVQVAAYHAQNPVVYS